VFGDQVVGGVSVVGTVVVLPPLSMSMAFRYREAGRIERQQLKWFFLATLLTIGTVVVLYTVATLTHGPIGETPLTVFAVALTTVPVAIGIAILRYHLYDIDRIISRTISYAILTVVVGAAFLLVLLAGQLLLVGVLSANSPLITAASTLAALAIFQPLRRRVQSAVDRRFDRARYDAQRTVDAFAGEVRNDVDIDSLHMALLATADDAVRPTSAAVWLRNVPNHRATPVS
jgi:hypothetical protein